MLIIFISKSHLLIIPNINMKNIYFILNKYSDDIPILTYNNDQNFKYHLIFNKISIEYFILFF